MNNPEVVIIGLGYIGLPTAALIASNNIKVYGVDIDVEVVKTINRGDIHIVEPKLDTAVRSNVQKGRLIASNKPIESNTFVIAVPTPFKGENEPDISYVQAAIKSIAPCLKHGNLLIIESTSPVGTTEKMMELICGLRPDLKNNIYLAYCPERVLPGNIMHELVYNDRVIGGIDELSTQKAILFYKKFIKGKLYPTNSKTAEMCKLVENSSRDIQIAFANELSLICDKANIDVWELIALANKHPRVNILQPGCGVGGHCIAVDPYFLVSDYPVESKIISTAREVNNYKSHWCAEKIQSQKLKYELKYGKNPSVAIMGLTFKPNIDDLRQSPANFVAQKILQNDINGKYFIVEPNINEHNVFKLTDTETAISNADIIVFLVAHNEFENIKIRKDKLVLDFCGIINSNKKTCIL